MDCEFCRKLKKPCVFRSNAETIARGVENTQNTEILRMRARSAHMQISEMRVTARSHGCPYLNEIDPDYFGKKLL